MSQRGHRAGIRRVLRAALATVVLLVLPTGARAHLVETGLGPFYDGISHLALTPDDLLAVVALALLAGLGGARAGRFAILALPTAWLAGGSLGLLRPAVQSSLVVSAVSVLILGTLVAVGRGLPPVLVASVAAVLGVIHGFLNGVAMASAGPGLVGLLGIASAVFAIVTLITAFVVSRRRPWERIVVRVAGSWISAIGLLMLGWLFRGAA